MKVQNLEENSGKTYDVRFGNYFLAMTPKAKAAKEKIDKLDFIKIKNLHASKDTVNSEKVTHELRENICKSRIW